MGMRQTSLQSVLKTIGQIQKKTDDGMEDFNSILLQLTLALMMIFMIAFFIFMNKIGGSLSQLNTLKQKVVEAEHARILQAMEQVTERYRVSYGLLEFMYIDPFSGEKRIEFSNKMKDGKWIAAEHKKNAFISGAKAAYQDYSDRQALVSQWRTQVTEIVNDPEVCQNAQINELLEERISRLENEVLELQSLAAAEIQAYLTSQPALVKDKEIQTLLSKINQNPTKEERQAYLKEVERRLKQYAKKYFASLYNIPLLEKVTP